MPLVAGLEHEIAGTGLGHIAAEQRSHAALEHAAVLVLTPERLTVALGELYAFYGRTAQMLENLFRDEELPLVRERFGAFRGYLQGAQDTLLSGRALRGHARRRTRAAVGHAIAFSTWKSLTEEQGLSADEAAKLMCSLVDSAR